MHLFPVVLILIVIWKLRRAGWPPAHATDVFNLAIGLIIIAYNVLYIIWVKWRK